MAITVPNKPGYVWLTVTTDPATGVSGTIDLASSAIVSIVTPDQADVAIFWIQVQIGAAWVYVADDDGGPLEFRMMRSRALAVPPEHTRPFDLARLAVPQISEVAYTFAVCVQPL